MILGALVRSPPDAAGGRQGYHRRAGFAAPRYRRPPWIIPAPPARILYSQHTVSSGTDASVLRRNAGARPG